MSYEKEEDERSEINWDHKVVRGCKIYTARHATNYSLLTTQCFCTPSPAELVPSPYKQGESAVRSITSAN